MPLKTNNQNNSIYIFLGVIILIGVAMFISINVRNGRQHNYSAGVVSALENEFDFGKISMKDGIVKHLFVLKNNGEETVKIGKIYTSCMCTTAYLVVSPEDKIGPFGMPGHKVLKYANTAIGPNEEIKIEANFDPAAHGPSGVGFAERSIYLETDSRKNPKIELKFTAVVAN
jgi:hypothetical protein